MIINENLLFNCFPAILILSNLAKINRKMRNRNIIRFLIFIYGIVGSVTVYYISTPEIRFQTAFEWFVLYSIGFHWFFEKFIGYIQKKVNKAYDKLDEMKGLIYTKEENEYAKKITEKISAFFYLQVGIIVLIIDVFLISGKILKQNSGLLYISIYNYFMAGLSFLGVYKIYTKTENTCNHGEL